MVAIRQFFAVGFIAAFLIVLLVWLLEDRKVPGDCHAVLLERPFGASGVLLIDSGPS